MTRTTIGIDLASKPENTGVCVIGWRTVSEAGEVVETSGRTGTSDVDLCALIDRADARIGIDVPLGWPATFTDNLGRYARGETWQAPHDRCRLRATDIWLTAELFRRGRRRIVPLSVSADLIGMLAMRAAHLLSSVGLGAMPRDGSGRVVEVYPAAALESWGLPSRGYKGPKRKGARAQLLSQIEGKLRGHVAIADEHRIAIVAIDHVFDAFVAALVVRCHELGLTSQVPAEHAAAAGTEGSILLPVEGSLELLSPASAP
jgi:hypothetical protein